MINSRFFNNHCAENNPNVDGARIQMFDQFENQPIYIVNSTFNSDETLGNKCSNDDGINSIDISWTIINNLFSHNHAIDNNDNPTQKNTPSNGNNGAIYNNGNTMTLSLYGTKIQHNKIIQHGSAIFFVSNNRSGDIRIDRSEITDNHDGTWYPTYPQISKHEKTPITITNSVIKQ